MMGSDYFPLKIMKRKDLDLDEVSDDLNDFSLSSPARKIRRLVSFPLTLYLFVYLVMYRFV